jgi:uncharacterized protein involved in exopolysaccharide biosynthesis
MIDTDSRLSNAPGIKEYASSPGIREPGHEFSLIEILTQLALRKRLILIFTAVALLVGIVLSVALPVRYTATTRIMPPQQTQSAASMLMNQLAASGAAPLAAIANNGLGLKSPNDLYIGLLNSRMIADAIIRRFNLLNVYGSRDMTAARKKLAKNTSVVSEKSGLMSVLVTDRDRSRAAKMANSYTEELRNLTKSLAVTEASQRRLFYEEQLRQAKDALVAAEVAFQRVQQQKGLVALDAQARAMIEGLSALRAKVAAKQVEVEALRSFSTDHNPSLQLAERELASLQNEVSRMEQHGHSSGVSDLGFGDVPTAELDYLRAEHEVKYRQALFDLLLRQYDAARLDESKEAAIIQVVEPAIEPDRRSSPKRGVIMLLLTAAGFFAGCVYVQFEWRKKGLLSDPQRANQIQDLKNALAGRSSVHV